MCVVRKNDVSKNSAKYRNVSRRAMSTVVIEHHYEEKYLKSARVVQAAGDNSCLFHSLSFNLNREEMYSNVYDTNNGFTLRHLVNDYIRDNLSKVVWTTPLICESFAEAIAGEGFSTSEYYTLMAKKEKTFTTST
jgi:hypothetical protein